MTAGPETPVGMGEYAVAAAPGEMLTMILGSCVGILLYDGRARVAAALHAMLPASPKGAGLPARYVDSGVPILEEAAIRAGARKPNIEAKIFGGANMFPKLSRTFVTHLGVRNVEAARSALASAGIPVVAEDVGGTAGRVAKISVDDGSVDIRLGEKRRKL